MMLDTNERYESQRLMAFLLLYQEVLDNRFDTLQAVCEQANVSNESLIERLSVYRSIRVLPDKMIFRDMCYIIYDLSENDRSIISFLENHYSKK